MVNWEEIKREYETTKITLAKLAEKHGVPLGTIKSQKSRDAKSGNEWLRDASKKVATKKQKVATPKKDARQQDDVPPEVKMVVEAFEEETEANSELTDAQRFFCLYYVKYINATKAYQKVYECDYLSANASGPRLLVNVSIRAEIARLKKARAAGIMLDKEDVLQKYIDIAFADIGDYVDYGTEEVPLLDEEGLQLVDENGEPRTYIRSYVRFKEGATLDNTIVSEVKQGKDGISVKLHDKMKALDVLAKYTDLLDERTKSKLQSEKLKLDLVNAEIKKLQLENERDLNHQQQQLNVEKAKLDIDRAQAELELTKIKIRKESGATEDEHEDDGFIEALKGVEVNWNE